jgi:hypothetical protein
MSDKDLYVQKLQAQLDAWRADADKLKAKLSGLSADAQLKMKEQLGHLEGHIEAGKSTLAEWGASGADAWEKTKDGAAKLWGDLTAKVGEVMERMKG